MVLNELLGGTRLSRDLDLFHDTEEVVEALWSADRELFATVGYSVRALCERRGFVEVEVSFTDDTVRVEWVCDSRPAFRDRA